MRRLLGIVIGLGLGSAALASDAATSASAGSNSFNRNGTAGATASYDGRIGFARTQADSGRISTARGVAVGVDRDGISLSVSNAIAPRFGPALATNFNMTIGRDGEVARSGGISVADGPLSRTATAGGSSGVTNGVPHATAEAGGTTDRFGRVDAHAASHTSPARDARIAYRHAGGHPHASLSPRASVRGKADLRSGPTRRVVRHAAPTRRVMIRR